MTKNCSKCKKCKKLDDFAIERRTKDGRRSKCKQCTKDYNKRYSLKNKEQIRSYCKNWYQNNKEYVINKHKKYCKNNRDKINLYIKNKKQLDPQFKLMCNLRTRLHSALKNNYKKGSAVKLLGCSIHEFKLYLESKFKPGMNWKNYNKTGWHIDHIKPLSSFDLSNIYQLKQACHFTNLQPLWATENLKKGSKIISY